MGNAGEARLDVIALGRDEVTATMNKVSGELDALKAKLGAYEKAQKASGQSASEAAAGAKSFGKSVEDVSKGVKEGIKPLNAAREGIENLKANFLVFPAAIAGSIAALTSWVDSLFAANTGTKWWAENSKDVVAAADSIAAVVKRLHDLNNPDKNPLEGLLGAEVESQLAKTREGVTQLAKKLDELKAIGGLASALGIEDANRFADIVGAMAGKYDEAGQHQKEIETTQRTINDLIRTEIQYRAEVAVALRDQEQAQKDLAQAERDRLGKDAVDKGTGAIPATDLFNTWTGMNVTGAPPKRPPSGGRAPVDPWQARLDAFREESARAERAEMERRRDRGIGDADFTGLQQNISQAVWGVPDASEEDARAARAAEESRLEMAFLLAEQHEHEIGQLQRKKAATDDLADSLMNLGELVGSALPENWGRFADALGTTLAEMAKVEDADKRGIIGAAGLAKAAFDLGAAEAKTARQRFAWKAAGEVAEAAAAAARLDFWAAGQHGLAAGLFGVAAATAGGGGGGAGGGRGYGASGGGSRGGGGAGGGRGDGGTTIVQLNTLVADRQSVGYAVQEADRARRGTGYARRRGA